MIKRRSRFNKYGAKRVDGFPSMLERSVYMILLARERAGEISDIKRQQAVVLQDGPKDQKISWKVDFSFIKNDVRWYCESKGIETNDYILKLKIWRKTKPAPLEIRKGSHTRPFLAETISI